MGSYGGRRPIPASRPSPRPLPARNGMGPAFSGCGSPATAAPPKNPPNHRPSRRERAIGEDAPPSELVRRRPVAGIQRMDKPTKKFFRCAVYTRKSTDHNLDLEFNSLDAQREACEAYIKSQAHEGWRLLPARYDDGAFSGASLDRTALQELLAEVATDKVDIIVVYKVDRL